jgi:hypothetical protein
MSVNSDRPFYKPVRQIQFFPELHERLEGENIQQWCKRHKKVSGRQPGFDELRLSPFYHVVMPPCTTLDKYRWCIRMFGLDGFMEFTEGYEWGKTQNKVWLFNEDFDAVQFKLMWLDQQEQDIAQTAP